MDNLRTWLAVALTALAVALGVGRPKPPRPPDPMDPAKLPPDQRALLERGPRMERPDPDDGP